MTRNICIVCGKETGYYDLNDIHLLPLHHCFTYGVDYVDNDDYLPTKKDFGACVHEVLFGDRVIE